MKGIGVEVLKVRIEPCAEIKGVEKWGCGLLICELVDEMFNDCALNVDHCYGVCC